MEDAQIHRFALFCVLHPSNTRVTIYGTECHNYGSWSRIYELYLISYFYLCFISHFNLQLAITFVMIKVANVIEEGRLGGPQRRIISVASACSSEIKTVVFLPSNDSEGFTELCEKTK